MDVIDKINEVTKKPSFVQYFFAKKNYKKLQKEFERAYYEYANQYGEDIKDQEYEYFEGEEVSGDEAYDQFAHTMNYQAEWDAAHDVVMANKNKYDYQRGDERDGNEYIEDLIDYMGFTTEFTHRSRKTRKDYWKMAEQEV